jgi:hypothetical protein
MTLGMEEMASIVATIDQSDMTTISGPFGTNEK